jgi:hypothetical protein
VQTPRPVDFLIKKYVLVATSVLVPQGQTYNCSNQAITRITNHPFQK